MYGNACSPQATSTPGVAAASAACFGITAKAVARNCSVNDASLARRVKLFQTGRVGSNTYFFHRVLLTSGRWLSRLEHHSIEVQLRRYSRDSEWCSGSPCVNSTVLRIRVLAQIAFCLSKLGKGAFTSGCLDAQLAACSKRSGSPHIRARGLQHFLGNRHVL